MKILAFTDLHGEKEEILNLKNKVKKNSPDLMICAGDVSDFGHKLQNTLEKFKSFNLPLLIVPGNHETNSELNEVCKDLKFVVNIHKRSYQINNYIFFGFGGEGFTKTSKDLDKIIPKFKKILKKDSKIILVTHQPPYKTKLDHLAHAGSTGNKSIRKFIEKIKPVLAISGHIHENENKRDKIKNTLIINPGPEGKIIKI